jgi:hypothetical protein
LVSLGPGRVGRRSTRREARCGSVPCWLGTLLLIIIIVLLVLYFMRGRRGRL